MHQGEVTLGIYAILSQGEEKSDQRRIALLIKRGKCGQNIGDLYKLRQAS